VLLLLFAKGSCTAPKVNADGTIPPHDGSDSLHLAFSVESTELQDWENLLAANGVAVAETRQPQAGVFGLRAQIR